MLILIIIASILLGTFCVNTNILSNVFFDTLEAIINIFTSITSKYK